MCCIAWWRIQSLHASGSPGGRAPQGASINYQGGANPYTPYNMEDLINEFTNKYICFYSLFKVRGAWSKGQLL